MKDLTNDAANNLAQLKSALEEVDAFLESAPKGRVNVTSRGDKTYYQHIIKKKSSVTRKAISQKENKLIDDLVMKGYFHRVRPKLLDEISSLSQFLDSYLPKEKDKEYMKMSKARKNRIDPLFPNTDSILRMWESESISKYSGHSCSLIYHTNNDELVRSKSEVIIANELFNKKDYLLYRYEPTVYFSEIGTAVHPDFGIVNLNNGNIYYWEHAGMMDNPEYANYFVQKVNKYILEGFEIGKNLILTFESSHCPLNTSVIRKTIANLK